MGGGAPRWGRGVGGGRGVVRSATPRTPCAGKKDEGCGARPGLAAAAPAVSLSSFSHPPPWWGGSVGEGRGDLGRRRAAAGLDAAAGGARRRGGMGGRFRGGGDGQSPRHAGASLVVPRGGATPPPPSPPRRRRGGRVAPPFGLCREPSRAPPDGVARGDGGGGRAAACGTRGCRLTGRGSAGSRKALPSPAAAPIVDDSRRPRRGAPPASPPYPEGPGGHGRSA